MDLKTYIILLILAIGATKLGFHLIAKGKKQIGTVITIIGVAQLLIQFTMMM